MITQPSDGGNNDDSAGGDNCNGYNDGADDNDDLELYII
jgi:hypothetical protein